MDLMNSIITIAIHITESFGYLGIFVVTMLEYACIPLPSEVVLPCVGLSIADGDYSFTLVLICTILAAIVGALISYAIGYYGGEFVINWLHKKMPKSKKAMLIIKKLFSNYGKITVLITRVLPFTRTYISLFAGAEKLDKSVFVIFSAVGITIWNSALLLIGYYIGNNRNLIAGIFRKYSIACLIIVSIILICLIIHNKRKKN